MPLESPHFGKSPRPDERAGGVSARGAPSDYQATLLRIIESASRDPVHLRRIIYELARVNLRKETLRRGTAMTPVEVQECMQALETAIGRVEDDCASTEDGEMHFPRLDPGPPRLENRSAYAGETFPPAPADSHSPRELEAARDLDAPPDRDDSREPDTSQDFDPPQPARSFLVPFWRRGAAVRHHNLPAERVALRTEPLAPLSEDHPPRGEKPQVEIVYPEREDPRNEQVRRRVWLWFITWPLVQVIGPIVFCVALYLGITGQFSRQAPQPQGEAAEQATLAGPSARPSGLPLPTAFGVYAVSNQSLVELNPLPIKAPDPRVMLSAEITQPSHSLLPDGKIVFIVFRRDLVNNAPQKVQVRVVAQVARAVTLSVGKVASKDLDSSWRIRANAYDFKVSPLAEDRQMIAVKPEDEDLVLPAGRYAVVLGGLAYDFTVQGPIAASAQCLESFEALNGPVFSECRSR
jgi:hypothetical protein